MGLLTSGSLEEEGLRASLQIPGAVWEEEGRRVELQGGGALAGDTVRVESLDVRSGPNHLHLAGTLDDQWALSWQVAAPDLAEGAGLQGTLSGEGTVSGPRDRPLVRASLEAEGVALAETVEVPLGDAEGADLADSASSARTDAEATAVADVEGTVPADSGAVAVVDRARLEATVDLSDQSPSRIRMEFVATPNPNGPQVEGRLAADGFLADHRLEAAADLSSGERLIVTLAGGLHLPAEEAQGAAEGAEDLRGVELERFTEFLPPGTSIQGVAGLTGEFTIDPEGRATVRAQGGIAGGRIRHPTGFGTEEERGRLIFSDRPIEDPGHRRAGRGPHGAGGHLHGARRRRRRPRPDWPLPGAGRGQDRAG